MIVARKIVARPAPPRIVATPQAWLIPFNGLGAVKMSIANISAKTNGDVLFAFRVGKWVDFYPSARFHLQMRDTATRDLLYEFATAGGAASPHAETWIEPAGEETVLICKMPQADAEALGARRMLYDLRVEDAESNLYRTIVGGIVNLTSGVTY